MTMPPFPTGLCCLFQTLQLAMRLMKWHGRYQHAQFPHHINETCPPHCALPHSMLPQRLKKKKNRDWVVLSMSGSLLSAQVSAWHFMLPPRSTERMGNSGPGADNYSCHLQVTSWRRTRRKKRTNNNTLCASQSVGQHPFPEMYKLFTYWGLIKIC